MLWKIKGTVWESMCTPWKSKDYLRIIKCTLWEKSGYSIGV